MTMFPDQPPLPPLPLPPGKPKITAEERRARQANQLMRIRFRVMIGRELDERGITTPTGIGEALGMPLAEATKLLTRHQWREGDLLLLEAAVERLKGMAIDPVDCRANALRFFEKAFRDRIRAHVEALLR